MWPGSTACPGAPAWPGGPGGPGGPAGRRVRWVRGVGRGRPPLGRGQVRRRGSAFGSLAGPTGPQAVRLSAPAHPARRGSRPAQRGGQGAGRHWGSPIGSHWPPWPRASRRSTGPEASEPIRLSRQSEGLYLLQRLRDEAHRFAISYHRTLRGKRMTVGALDGVPGLGPKRRTRLIEQFGGLAGLRNASMEELLGVSWLPAEVGAAVFERLHTPLAAGGPADRNGQRWTDERVPGGDRHVGGRAVDGRGPPWRTSAGS